MKRTVVQSSNLLSVGYDEKTLTLEVEFGDSSIYQYTRIPKQVYVELMSAEKKGVYFCRYIRDNRLYGCSRTHPTLKWCRP